MVARIKVALDSRRSDDTLIVARTDAIKTLGMDEAMRRAEAYAEAGADVLFCEAPPDVAAMRAIARRFAGVPLLANLVHGGVTPVLSPGELADIGYRIAIFPAAGFLSACAALDGVYASLKRTGGIGAADLFPFAGFNDLMGFGDVLELEERHGAGSAEAGHG